MPVEPHRQHAGHGGALLPQKEDPPAPSLLQPDSCAQLEEPRPLWNDAATANRGLGARDVRPCFVLELSPYFRGAHVVMLLPKAEVSELPRLGKLICHPGEAQDRINSCGALI